MVSKCSYSIYHVTEKLMRNSRYQCTRCLCGHVHRQTASFEVSPALSFTINICQIPISVGMDNLKSVILIGPRIEMETQSCAIDVPHLRSQMGWQLLRLQLNVFGQLKGTCPVTRAGRASCLVTIAPITGTLIASTLL